MLLTKEIKIKITKSNIEHFKSKGYICSLKDEILIKTEDLNPGSNKEISVKC